MKLDYTPEQIDFRDNVRAFLAEALSPEVSRKVRLSQRLTKKDMDDWHTALNERGWLANNWPKEFGGAGWDAVERHIFDEETSLAHAPRIVPFGLTMLGPVLQAFGSKEQQDYFLPRIKNGEHWWCQGYSEPGAGSDLASLKTSAVLDGDHYIVNGQKTWTTLGQHANWIFCLVRTNTEVKQQEGISFLLIDMDSPGVTVRPIVLLDGEPEVNEVFFDDVKVPVKNLVGEQDKGWTYAKYLLLHERTNIAGVGYSNAALASVKEIAHKRLPNGKRLIDSPYFAARVAQVEIDLMAMATTNLRMISKAAQGEAPGAESSMLKIKGTEISQEISDLMRRALGPHGVLFQADAILGASEEDFYDMPEYASNTAGQYFNLRKLSIFGGSNEIQRSIISKAILRL